jgi:hypothetical protein
LKISMSGCRCASSVVQWGEPSRKAL